MKKEILIIGEEARIIHESLRNIDWFRKNFELISKEHPGEFIFILNQEIVFSTSSGKELKDKMEEYRKQGKIREMHITYIRKPGEIWVLDLQAV